MNMMQHVARFYFSHFPIEKGKWYLWQLFTSRYRGKPQVAIEYPLKYGFRLQLDTRDMLDYFIYYWRCYEPNETWAIRKILRPGDIFIDIGANIGYFSVLAARLVGPTGRVFAFEPVPPTVERLRHNIKINGVNNITIV